MATQPSILVWRISWTGEPCGLQSMGHKESDATERLTLALSRLFFRGASVFNIVAAVAICSDFGAQENNVCHCFHFFPIYLLS